MDVVSGLMGGLAGIASALVILLTIALLMGMDAGHAPAVMAETAKTRPLLVSGLSDYTANVRRYMVATTGLGLVQGFVDFVALVLLGVPGAFIWGVLAFLCSFIPNVGYFLAIIPPIIFGGLVGGWPGFPAASTERRLCCRWEGTYRRHVVRRVRQLSRRG